MNTTIINDKSYLQPLQLKSPTTSWSFATNQFLNNLQQVVFSRLTHFKPLLDHQRPFVRNALFWNSFEKWKVVDSFYNFLLLVASLQSIGLLLDSNEHVQELVISTLCFLSLSRRNLAKKRWKTCFFMFFGDYDFFRPDHRGWWSIPVSPREETYFLGARVCSEHA